MEINFLKCPTVEAYLPGLLDTFRPDLVLYDAGVDPHWEDELGRLRLTDRGKATVCKQAAASTVYRSHLTCLSTKKYFPPKGFIREIFMS